MSICLPVPQDLAYYYFSFTVTLFMVPGKVYNYFKRGYKHPTKKIAPEKLTPTNFFCSSSEILLTTEAIIWPFFPSPLFFCKNYKKNPSIEILLD